MRKTEPVNSPNTFRAAEVSQIFQWVKSYESGSIVGMSNVGKSTLFQHLLNSEVLNCHLLEEAQNYTFLRINLNNLPDFNNRSVYSLILDQLEMQYSLPSRTGFHKDSIDAIGSYHDLLLNSDGDELKIQRYFKLAVRAGLQDPASRLVFLFDQFDQLYNYGNNSLFYNLRGLHDAYQNRVIFLVFTRQPLSELQIANTRQQKQMESFEKRSEHLSPDDTNSSKQAHEEFYELLQTNRLYLKAYNETDSEHLLRKIAQQNHQAFDETLAKRLFSLTRGHAGLLRTCYLYAIKNNPDIFLQEINLAGILTIEMISEECEKIWTSLTQEEQIGMVAQVRNLPVNFSNQMIEKRLEWKGLLSQVPEGHDCSALRLSYTIFSPLFEQYTRKQKTSLDRPIFVDWKSHAIYVFGKQSEPLSKTEYIAFKTLYEQENMVVSMEELYQLCYPDEVYDKLHSPGSLATMMHRIRQKLRITESDGLLQAKHKQGYILWNRLPGNED